MNINIFNALDEFVTYCEMNKNDLTESDQLINNLVFNIRWHLLKSPGENPVIALYRDENSSKIQVAYFSCAEVTMKKLTTMENGTRQYEENTDLPVYTRAYTFQALYNVSGEAFKMIIDALFNYPVDAVLMYIYKKDYEQLKLYLEENKQYNYYASCYSDAFDGEIGHNRFDSMQLVFPNTFDEIFEPFQKKKQHRYNIRHVKRVKRIAEAQYAVRYKYISPLSNSEADIEKVFSDVELIFKNSWQSELNFDNHQEKLTFLYDHKKLMLLVIYAEEEPVSYFYGYVENGRILESWMAYNSNFSRYSFGLLALVEFLQYCINDQIQSLEFGGTTHQYKTDLVNKKEPIHEIVVFNPTATISRELRLIKRCYPKALI
ncbi:GNAT family N-acetyltransferase [Paenibacillus aquistagni]|uniref:GNAT family N-acetyltransferase n=1 Tax=Paenibacillus aquistagni TaxID=1852522 RepID=UPI000B50F1B5|nr:GNAT family N-acetyltransferase [Paenibacillus aquistagni]NMM55491.1 GNAT family N-acetyltransferase [Paenibacillus aquistagni]